MQEGHASITFAQTKIQPPRSRGRLIERAPLERELGDALATRRLTLLQAPAGWGKTSALTRQLAQLPTHTALAWIAADEDDDVQRFLACLSSALEPLDLAWRVSPHALATLSQAERGLRQVADELVNALASAESTRGLIVIDDAHRFTDARVFELLQLLLQRLPSPHWGVVIASRTEPELPLARWRAQGELAEFRQAELRFDETEVAALLQARGDGGGNGAAADLLTRTGGWAVGLALFLSAERAQVGQRSVTPNQRHVFDYLADEVLAGMDAELREFLLRCSVLPELTAERCAHVSQRPRAAALLEAVDRQGLFVSRLDAEVHTLRLHDLFRDFLEDRLQREHGDEMPLLLRRAAEHEPDLARAIAWLTRAGAWDPAAQALAERGPSLIAAGGGPTVERLLSLFPAAAFERHPDLHFLRGLCAYQRFDFEVLVPSMERAAAGYEVAERNESAAAARIYLASGLRNSGRHAQAAQTFQRLAAEGHDGALGALVAYFCTWEAFAEHRPHAVAPAFAQALERLERLPDAELWGQCFLHCFLVGLPQMAPLIERFDRGAMRLTEQRASHLRASVMHARAATALGAGEPGAAHTWLASADEDVRWLGSPRALLTENLLLHLAVDALLGRREACLAAAQRMRADTEESGPANQRTHGSSLVMSEARARWLLGDDDAVRALAAEAQHVRNSFEWTYAGSERAMVDAMVALIDGRDADAERLLHPAHAGDPEDLLFFRASQVLLMRAEVQRRQGRLDDAARTLRPWLDGVHGGAPVGGALMSGRRTLEPLSRATWAGRLDARDAALLLRLLQQLGDGDTAAEPASERPGGLSEREWQVLERIAAGDSNKLIARALDLSPFTVKRHVANIFDKLGLNSRTQAAAWLRDAS